MFQCFKLFTNQWTSLPQLIVATHLDFRHKYVRFYLGINYKGRLIEFRFANGDVGCVASDVVGRCAEAFTVLITEGFTEPSTLTDVQGNRVTLKREKEKT